MQYYKDEALDELVQALKDGTMYKINTAPVEHKQRLIIQYEDIIQGFDCGMLAALAAFYVKAPDNAVFDYNKLDLKVMESISFGELFDEKDSDKPLIENAPKVIQRYHKQAGFEFTDDDLEKLRDDIKNFIFVPECPLVDFSPTLSFMNGLLAMYVNSACEDILFVVPNIGLSKEDAEPYVKGVAKFLMGNFFQRQGDIPIYIDYNEFETFWEYAKKMIDTTKNTDDFVFVSTSKELFKYSFSENVKNASFIFPENDHMETGRYHIALAGSSNYLNEYICYTNKPFRLEDPKVE